MSAEAVTGRTGPSPVDIVAAVMGVDAAALSEEDGPATLPVWTSRKQIELIVALEECYEVSFDHEEVFGVRTIGELSAMLRGKGVR